MMRCSWVVRQAVSYSIFIGSLLWVFISSAQNLDSLNQAYYSIPSTTKDKQLLLEKYELLGKIVDKEMFTKPKTVIARIDTLAELVRVVKGEKDYNRIKYRTKGFAYASQANTVEALECYRKYAQVFDKSGVDDGYFLIDVGNVYFSLELHRIAKKTYKEAEQLFLAEIGKDKNAYNGLGTLYGNYSLIAEKQHHLDRARYYSEKFLELQQEIAKDTFQLALSHFSLASILIKDTTVSPQEAVNHYEKAIAYLTIDGLEEKRQYQQFIVYLPLAYSFLATAYNKMCNLEMTDLYIKKSIEEVDKLGYKGLKMVVYGSAGEAYTLQKRYAEAIPFLDSVLVWSKDIRNTRELSHALRQLIRIYSASNNYEQAFKYTRKYMLLKDTLESKRDELMVINEMVLERENQITIEQQQNLIEAEQKINTGLYLVLFLVLLAMLLTLFFLWQLRQKNKLISLYTQEIEAANQMNEVMLSVVGHDLRSPFSVVVGNTRQILEKTSQTSNVALHQKAVQLYKSAKNAFMMMDGLLQWIALRKNGYQIKPSEFELNTVVYKTIERLESIADNQAVKVNLKTYVQAQLYSDATFLQIIIRNIVTNAIKHSSFDSEVVVELGQEGNDIIINVLDTGTGFSKEAIQDFGREKNTLEIAKKGHGLGLSIVKELSNILGLEVSINNLAHQKGAMVSVKIPAQQVKKVIWVKSMQSQSLGRNSATTYLSETTKILLTPYVLQLQQYEIFEGTAIQKIVSEIQKELPQNSEVENWIYKLKRSIAENDDAMYQEVLKEGSTNE